MFSPLRVGDTTEELSSGIWPSWLWFRYGASYGGAYLPISDRGEAKLAEYGGWKPGGKPALESWDPGVADAG